MFPKVSLNQRFHKQCVKILRVLELNYVTSE